MTNECIEEQRILNTAEYVENRVAKATEAHLRCKGCDCEYHRGDGTPWGNYVPPSESKG